MSQARVLAFDLGTGACKASLWSANGQCTGDAVVPYPTSHPRVGWHEQRPVDWWGALVQGASEVLAVGRERTAIDGIALSGHSLGVVPLGADGRLLLEETPIWSDARGGPASREFFRRIEEAEWYRRTGCGFPPPLYPIFKLMWLKATLPDVWRQTVTVLGTKDYVNFLLTGTLATDLSSASGSGALPTDADRYAPDLLDAAGLDVGLLPQPRRSTEIIGRLTRTAAESLGLPAGIPVVVGGVDNSCMATGALNIDPGDVYVSLGSSSWVTATTVEPVLDVATRPYTFRALEPGRHHSALSTFSSGMSIGWVRSLLGAADRPLTDDELIELARQAPVGSNGLLFLPMLAGGAPIEGGPDVRGGFVGLDLSHTRADIARACLEGVALSVARAMRLLNEHMGVPGPVRVVGGGSRNPWIRQLYADLLGLTVVKSSVDQQAASLGAAACAFVGLGAWAGFESVRLAHVATERNGPDPATTARYAELMEPFEAALIQQSALAPHLRRATHQEAP